MELDTLVSSSISEARTPLLGRGGANIRKTNSGSSSVLRYDLGEDFIGESTHDEKEGIGELMINLSKKSKKKTTNRMESQ